MNTSEKQLLERNEIENVSLRKQRHLVEENIAIRLDRQ